MKKSSVIAGIVSLALAFGFASCSSSGDAKKDGGNAKAAKGGPAKTGNSTLLDVAFPGGGVDVGGISFQFLGSTWIQSANGTPVAAGSLKGAPELPQSPAKIADDTYDLSNAEDVANFTAAFALVGPEVQKIVLKDLVDQSVGQKGTLVLTAEQVYAAGKWQTLEAYDKFANGVVGKKTLTSEIKAPIETARKGFRLGYTVIADEPFITLEKN